MDTLIDQVTRATLSALESEALVDGADAALLASFVEPTHNLLSGGKRIRGILSIAGGLCVRDDVTDEALSVAAALELFQGAALVHDDIMDQSPTRRGQPAVHVAFDERGIADGLTGHDELYGVNAGICSGDFLLSIATTHMLGATNLAAVTRFQKMCTEVAYGQYLDVRAENIDLSSAQEMETEEARSFFLDLRKNAFNVLRHKSAHYSVRDPLLIGADAAGASEDLIDILRRIGSPLGEAFQLRDDALAMTGDPKNTGKPTGGDIREGKRTVLLLTTLARVAGTEDMSRIIRALGNDIDATEVEEISAIMRSSGAWAEHEELIRAAEERAQQAWVELPPSPGKDLLATLMAKLIGRNY